MRINNSLTGGDVFGPYLDRPNLVGNPYIRNTSTRLWLNPAAFTLSPVGTFGSLGSDTLRSPGFFDIDVAVSRYFKITEQQKLELRFEFFNVANHVNFGHPDNTLTDSTFGVILSDVSPRILQFALRYTF
jgi:hypothetical protein